MATTTAAADEWTGLTASVRTLTALIIAVIVVAALYLGREIFVPLALAILFSFVLAPLAGQLQRWFVPRALAVVSVVLIAFAGIFVLGGSIASQIAGLTEHLPQYHHTIRLKLQSVRGATAGSEALERAAEILQYLGSELDKPEQEAATPLGRAVPRDQTKPVAVEIHERDQGALATIGAVIWPLIHPLATMGITLIFITFILLQREDLRNRLIRLAGAHDLQKTTVALDDAAHRLSRLFLSQLALNAGFGAVIGVGLWLIGIPSPVLWGILATIFRFVPYVGAFISAAFPLALAAAVDPGWSMLLWTAALFLVAEFLVGNFAEPLLLGHSTGLSPVAVIVSATFWTSLWGPMGLLLAMPLTVCLVVLGRHVDQLKFFDVLLGNSPALSPPEMFYQRMLAGDPAEAAQKAEEFLKQQTLTSYYDTIALNGLRLAQADAVREAIDLLRMDRIKDAVNELIDDLADHDDHQPSGHLPTADAEAVAALEDAENSQGALAPILDKKGMSLGWQSETPVVCIAGRNPLDEAAAEILGQLLARHGLTARVEPTTALLTANPLGFNSTGVALVCLSYLDATVPAHMRYAVRRVRRKIPNAQILICAWGNPGDTTILETLREQVRADLVVTAFRQAIETCVHLARAAQEPIAKSAVANAV